MEDKYNGPQVFCNQSIWLPWLNTREHKVHPDDLKHNREVQQAFSDCCLYLSGSWLSTALWPTSLFLKCLINKAGLRNSHYPSSSKNNIKTTTKMLKTVSFHRIKAAVKRSFECSQNIHVCYIEKCDEGGSCSSSFQRYTLMQYRVSSLIPYPECCGCRTDITVLTSLFYLSRTRRLVLCHYIK